MNTSSDRNVGFWLNTAEGLREMPRQTSAAGTYDSLSASAKWNVAVLVISGLASTAFCLTVLTELRAPASPVFEPAISVSSQASAVPAPPPLVTPDFPGRPVVKEKHAAETSTVRRTRANRATKPVQSRVARLLLGDGTVEVRPFPTLGER